MAQTPADATEPKAWTPDLGKLTQAKQWAITLPGFGTQQRGSMAVSWKLTRNSTRNITRHIT